MTSDEDTNGEGDRDAVKLSAFPTIDPEEVDDGLGTEIPDRMEREEIKNRLFEGDCLDILPRFPENSVDMVLCDLPYGSTENQWDSQIPLDRLWHEYERVVKPRGAIVLTSQHLFTARLIMSNPDLFSYKWVWQKSKATNFLNANRQPLRKHEDVCVFYDKAPVYNPQMREGDPYDKGVRKDQLSGSYGDFDPVKVESDGARYPVDVVYFKTAESEGEVWHSTQKPVSLARYMVRTYTEPGDLVLDNAFGSGSFLVGALREGRSFVGIEENEDTERFKEESLDMMEIASGRLEAAWAQMEPADRETVDPVGLPSRWGTKPFQGTTSEPGE